MSRNKRYVARMRREGLMPPAITVIDASISFCNNSAKKPV
jgi:hypothetical protein